MYIFKLCRHAYCINRENAIIIRDMHLRNVVVFSDVTTMRAKSAINLHFLYQKIPLHINQPIHKKYLESTLEKASKGLLTFVKMSKDSCNKSGEMSPLKINFSCC